jgi:hypothetical protein
LEPATVDGYLKYNSSQEGLENIGPMIVSHFIISAIPHSFFIIIHEEYKDCHKVTDALKLQRMCLFAITGESKGKWLLAGHMQTLFINLQ